MAESLLLPLLRGVAGKASGVFVQEVTRMCGIDNDRGKLERQLLAIQCMLTDAEEKSETNPAIKRWMKDLKAVAYEADDVLEDFQYEKLHRDAQIGDSSTRKVLGYFTPHSPLLFRVTMSKKLSRVLKKINKLVTEMKTFGLVKRAEAPQLPHRETHSILNVDKSADILGRDNDNEVVVKLLLDQRDERKLQVLPIVGMGGLGKATLAKMVYNDDRVENHFELKMWHCVSENFEIVPLLKAIIELATDEKCEHPNRIEVLQRQVKKAIGQKRFLLVLDDVWNEQEKRWEELKPLLSSNVGGHGSVIVVTTRSRRVASIMGTLGSHELQCLNGDDSWKLFTNKAFSGEVREHARLVALGRHIVKKCRGLPLALKTMGGLMSSKQLVSEWETIAESNIGDSVEGKDEIISILKLSYIHLSSEMKQCFAFCSVFPKGYEMDKDVLIQLWMANGFIQEERTMDLEQKGNNVFNNLVWRSFLQDVKPKKNDYYYMATYESIGCKMHDLMHDLAKDIADECATSEQLIQQETSIGNVRHMNISDIDDETNIMGLFKRISSLRTLITPSLLKKDLKGLNLASLRALHVGYLANLDYHYDNHSELINIKHLRYLDLSLSKIAMLPSSICEMYSLQTLRLNCCSRLKYLPEAMRTMRKLRHLYLLGCDRLKRMPQNIGLLNNLHTLTTFVLDTEAGHGIEELKDLCHLANKLELYNLRKVNSRENGEEANLHQKENISELVLFWGRDTSYLPKNTYCNEEEVLESLTPNAKLNVLEVHGYSGLKIPKWMSDPQMLQCLRTLHISNSPGCKDLSTLWLLVSLEHLNLSNMGNLTTLCKNISVEAEGCTPPQMFPKLKRLHLDELPKLQNWVENTTGEANCMVTFPELEMLEISSCPKLASVPDCPVLKELETYQCCSIAMSSFAHLTTLSKLTYDAKYVHVKDFSMRMPLGSWPSLMKLHVRSPLNMLTNLEVQTNQGPLEHLQSLWLSGLNCFTDTFNFSVHLGRWQCFIFVEDLSIARCNDLVSWPMEELKSLIHLRFLRIKACHNFEGKGSSSEEIISLSHLEKFHIKDCDNLLEIPKLPTSLKRLRLDCPRLVALPSNLGDLVSLKHLKLNSCHDLNELPDGMDGLTCLEKLRIVDCPAIEKFSQGLLQRLSTIQDLDIQLCPGLQRRFRKGGEYFGSLSLVQQICFAWIEELEEEAEVDLAEEAETDSAEEYETDCHGIITFCS